MRKWAFPVLVVGLGVEFLFLQYVRWGEPLGLDQGLFACGETAWWLGPWLVLSIFGVRERFLRRLRADPFYIGGYLYEARIGHFLLLRRRS
ncbi:MAG TPA: hypothetical protein EYP17_10840 [Candidatus Latescibacteria bacterium]|nr:hypothetical protein [Candidatus Latescibacterota bacterium]